MAQGLPPGWEAKYDSNVGRYFFINHFTKETTWQDPRVSVQPQYNPFQQQTAPAAPVQPDIPMQQRHVSFATNNGIQETNLGGLFEGDDNSNDLISNTEKQRLKRKVQAELDLEGVTDGMIFATLEAASYNADLAVEMLKDMGFRKKGEKLPSTESSERWEVGSSSKARKPRITTPSPASSSSSSSNAKTKSSLETAGESSTKKYVVVTSNKGASSHSSSKVTTPKKATSKGKTSSVASATKPVSTLEEVLNNFEITFDELEDKFKAADSGSSLLFKDSTSGSSSKFLGQKGSMSSMFKDLSTTSSSNVLGGSVSSATSTSFSKLFDSKSKAKSSSVAKISPTSSAVPSTIYKLSDKLKATGQNKRLAKGPDRSLKSKHHMRVHGSDATLSVGRRPELSVGPAIKATGSQVRAKGADRSLRIGRNRALAKGPQRSM